MFELASRNISWIPKRQALEATGPLPEIQITYRFGKPGESEDSSVGSVGNGSLSYLTNRPKSGKNLLVVTGLREKEAKGSPSPLPGSRNVISTFSESNSMTL